MRQSRAIGYAGEIWPVNPRRTTMDGLPCFPDLAALPGVPDAAFVSVPSARSVDVVAELSALGTGGAVCHASGFAEDGPRGEALQHALVRAAAPMALVGPNCLGLVNYLDGAALWADQHGGARVERGVAIIAQSGNLALNLTMQRRSLPLAFLVTIGNAALTGVPELVEAMLEDDRVTAIGLHLESVPDVAELSRAAVHALRRKVPLVVLKTGSSELGAQAARGHTSSIATPDVLCDALFRRLGVARVHRVEAFLETLKLLHVHGALPGARITSASCSGGEAALVADLAEHHGVTMPSLSPRTTRQLEGVLGERVKVGNPLDYHTYIWGDRKALSSCFTALLGTDADAHLLVLDLPRADRCDVGSWDSTVQAFIQAQRTTGARACVVSSLPETLPESLGQLLLAAGIAPMQGISECLEAVAAAGEIGAAQVAVGDLVPAVPAAALVSSAIEQLDEARAKEVLSAFGVPTPRREVATTGQVPEAAARIGFPVVVKALSAELVHKSAVGGVQVGLRSEDEVRRAVRAMAALGDRFLVEPLVTGVVAELLVGLQRDPHFGLSLTLGAGGALVELLDDTVTLLLPVTGEDVRAALARLRIWPVLHGYLGVAADVDSVVRAVEAMVAFAGAHADRLVELEVNPMLVLTDGAVAVDAVVRWSPPLPSVVPELVVEGARG